MMNVTYLGSVVVAWEIYLVFFYGREKGIFVLFCVMVIMLLLLAAYATFLEIVGCIRNPTPLVTSRTLLH